MTKVSFVIAAKAIKGVYLLKCDYARLLSRSPYLVSPVKDIKGSSFVSNDLKNDLNPKDPKTLLYTQVSSPTDRSRRRARRLQKLIPSTSTTSLSKLLTRGNENQDSAMRLQQEPEEPKPHPRDTGTFPIHTSLPGEYESSHHAGYGSRATRKL